MQGKDKAGVAMERITEKKKIEHLLHYSSQKSAVLNI